MSKALAATKDSAAIIGEARALLQNGHVNDAAELCQQALDAYPQNGDVLYTLAVARRLPRMKRII